jgi:hypothetical protein
MKIASETSAGIAYLLPAVAIGAIWYTLLFVGNTPRITSAGMLRYAFVEAPERHHFWWLALLPTLWLFLAAAYFSAIARSKLGAVALCGVGIVVAVATWLTMDWTLAVFATFPLVFGVQRVKWHLTARSRADAP